MNEFYFAQKAFIVKDGCLLMIQKSEDDPFQPNKWEVPGGRMKFGEDVDEHIKREVFEEVGINISTGKPFYVWQWQLNKQNMKGENIQMQIVATARFCSLDSNNISLENQESDDYISKYEWVSIENIYEYDIIENMLPVVSAFLHELDNK